MSLSSNVFERRTSTGSELFSPLIRLDATNYVLLSVFTLIETICPNVCSKSQLKCAKSPLPVDVRRSKTSLLKLPNKDHSNGDHHHGFEPFEVSRLSYEAVATSCFNHESVYLPEPYAEMVSSSKRLSKAVKEFILLF